MFSFSIASKVPWAQWNWLIQLPTFRNKNNIFVAWQIWRKGIYFKIHTWIYTTKNEQLESLKILIKINYIVSFISQSIVIVQGKIKIPLDYIPAPSSSLGNRLISLEWPTINRPQLPAPNTHTLPPKTLILPPTPQF